ncbi:P-loop containing nucleoside triphosphate hydrolase protein [Dunaliella salina]|uniref:P-loop containing nucleoside triphosphate hydrolase protein n=1 Tax=Dunaliella salina TaxID=3046 RepID=A0ABQ7GZ69_DUNSA|nr:P-loop containing nucleoside triphosphate hydrolase protein [Dunaliella salina]|eukprot:KAF5839903.1 P-loop containing nucleoside triphosphate hydrolase protein [Dunaliella salina]
MADALAEGLQGLALTPDGLQHQPKQQHSQQQHSQQQHDRQQDNQQQQDKEHHQQQQQQQQAEQTAHGSMQGASAGSEGGASSSVAGAAEALQALRELIGWPSMYRNEGAALGVQWPKGVLLHGPPGCGKTLLVRSVVEELGAALHIASASDVFGAYLGESEGRLRAVFEAAQKDADEGRTTVVFLDEVDALCPRRDGQRQHESRVVAQLLTLLDGAASGGGRGAMPARGMHKQQDMKGHVVVVAATNRPNALDPALRRPGRLDREVVVPVPSATERAAILRLHTQGLQLHPRVDLASIATSCHGYSGADLAALAREAALHSLTRAASHLMHNTAPTSQQSLPPLQQHWNGSAPRAANIQVEAAVGHVEPDDFQEAMKRVGPSIVRGMEVEAPHTSWEDVGGLPDVKKRLRQAVEWPLCHPEAFQRLGLAPPRGVLLYGPPGCSKTTLARAAASASKATLLPLSCAQAFSMFVGEGESLVRDVFRRARQASPSIIFLDEVRPCCPMAIWMYVYYLQGLVNKK